MPQTKTRTIPIKNKNLMGVNYEFVNDPLTLPDLCVKLETSFPIRQSMEVVFKVKVISPTLMNIVFFVYDYGNYSHPEAFLHVYEKVSS